jgi:hypothetical protein
VAHALGLSLHVHPASTWHAPEHPSPDTRFPSSQASPGSITPFPHAVVHPAGFSVQSALHVSVPPLYPRVRHVFPFRSAPSHPSACTPPAATPSPHVAAHTLGFPLHTYPRSAWQPGAQPSPGTAFPSSQVSLPTAMLSPQVVRHRLGLPEQVQPASTWHVAEHPSPLTWSPSSHASVGIFTPSPQGIVHRLGVPLHDHPVSTWHAVEQPSPTT